MVADVLSFAHKFQATIARAPSMSDPSSPTDVPPPHIHLQSAPFLSDGPTVDDLLAHSRSPSAPGRFPSTSDEGGVPPLPYRRRARTADPLSTAHTQRSQPVTTRPFVNVPGAPEYTPLSSPLSDPDANRSRVHTKTIETDVNTFRALLPTYISFTTSVDPYVHAGALGVVTFFGYIAGRLGLSWMWIVAAWVVGLHALYQARELVRARVKWESERIEGALKIEKPGEEGESAEWINFLLAQLWPIMDRNLFAKVIDILEDNFHQFAPPMIADIQVVDFDLGMHAPRLSNIKVLPHGCGTDTVLMDCTVSLQPVPYTVYAGENIETGPVGGQSIYVLLNARIGKAQLGTVTVPIVIESVGFEARARVQIVLYDKPPFARHLRFTLLTPPRVTFAARPLKLVNVMSLPLLSQFIQKVVDETVKMLAVNPNAVSLDLEQILLGKETLDDVTSIGVLKIVIHEAKDLMAADVTGTSDPFVAIDYGGLETHKISSLSLTGLGVDKATGPITGGLTAVQTLAASDLASVRPTPTDVRSTSPPPTIGSPENLSDLGGDAETPLTDTSGLSTAYYHVLRPLGQTRVIPKSTDPVFNETHYIRVTSADVINTLPLRLRVFDFDTFTKDDLLGVLEFSLRDVVDRPGVEAVKGWYPLRFPGVDTTKNPATGNTVALADADALLGGSSKHVRFPVPKLAYGELKVSVQFLPKVVVPKVGFVESFLEPKKSVVNVKEMADKYPGGILSIHIHQCADLIVKATERAGPYPSSFVDVHLNDEHVFRTRAKPSNPSPYINAMTEHYVRDWRRAVVRLAIRDQRALERDPTIGSAVVGLEELFADDIGMLLTKWFYLKNGIGAGRIRVSFIFRPVQAQEPAHLRGYPTGVLQLRSISLHDFASLHHRESERKVVVCT
ncbi:hypothetical protein BJ742DRAFT_52827 [Cladochytrium replicatum]|nr:hypothetical protein BJ742DRAFT_52827 [Cladochytrium replicatum]